MDHINKTSLPKVSIVIPCYNSSGYISRAIESGLEQTYNNIEVIVVNDGSTDGSRNIVENYKDKIVIIDQENKGGAAARNTGLKAATGEYVKFLDADDYLDKDAVASQVQQSSEIGKKSSGNKTIVYGEVVFIDETGKTLYRRTQPVLTGGRDDLALLIGKAIITTSPLHKREYLEDIGGFNESLRANQEHDLNIRLYLNGVRFTYFETIVYYHRKHKSMHRISVNKKKWAVTNPYFTYELINYYKKLFKENDVKIDGAVSAELANRLIMTGRQVARAGNADAADKYFKEGIKTDPGLSYRKTNSFWNSKPYRFIKKIFGLKFTEDLYYHFSSFYYSSKSGIKRFIPKF